GPGVVRHFPPKPCEQRLAMSSLSRGNIAQSRPARHTPQRPHCLAEEAVHGELVSAATNRIVPFVREISGNFCNSAADHQDRGRNSYNICELCTMDSLSIANGNCNLAIGIF